MNGSELSRVADCLNDNDQIRYLVTTYRMTGHGRALDEVETRVLDNPNAALSVAQSLARDHVVAIAFREQASASGSTQPTIMQIFAGMGVQREAEAGVT